MRANAPRTEAPRPAPPAFSALHADSAVAKPMTVPPSAPAPASATLVQPAPPASVKVVELKVDHAAPKPSVPAPQLAQQRQGAGAAPGVSDKPPADRPQAEKPPAKPEDPFAGLDSLEAEMARLLGREKLN
jgi:flagellar protein FliO/FliZ